VQGGGLIIRRSSGWRPGGAGWAPPRLAPAGGATCFVNILRRESVQVGPSLGDRADELTRGCSAARSPSAWRRPQFRARSGIDPSTKWPFPTRHPERVPPGLVVQGLGAPAPLLPVMTADSGRWPGRSSVRGRLPETPPGQGSESQADDGDQRWDRQSEAVPERRLDWEQPKLQQGSRAVAGPQ